MNYTITTTAPQEAALTFIVGEYNRVHPEIVIPLTNAGHLQDRVDSLLANYTRQKEENEQAQALILKRRYDALPPEKQTQIDTILGGS